MVRDLRNAGAWASGTAPNESNPAFDDPNTDADTVCNRVYAATKKLVIVQTDLNGNGDCMDTDPRETVTYELTGPTDTCPTANIIRRNNQCLVANVVTPLGMDKLFSYYDSNNIDMGDNPSPLDDIKRIKITFSVRETNPNPRTRSSNAYVTSTLSSSVLLRN